MNRVTYTNYFNLTPVYADCDRMAEVCCKQTELLDFNWTSLPQFRTRSLEQSAKTYDNTLIFNISQLSNDIYKPNFIIAQSWDRGTCLHIKF